MDIKEKIESVVKKLLSDKKLLDKFDVVAMWVCADGTLLYSPGFEALIRN